MKPLAGLAVTLGLLATARADAPEPFAEEMKAAFTKLDKPGKLTWVPRLSPPFPDRGPRSGTPIVLRYYAYAASVAPGLHDGEHVAGVWAWGRLAGKSHFDVTVERLTDVGIQGVRPIADNELAAMKQASSVRGWLEELAVLSNEPGALAAKRQQLRPYYCTWKKLNGVIAKEIVEQQSAFFAWLACDGSR
jgi:hypothetical protein